MRAGWSGTALAYLREHAISPEVAACHGVTEEGDALVFPTADADGRPSPRRRSLNGAGPKVRGEPGREVGLWWLDGLPGPADTVLLCEGESDALAAATARLGEGFLPGFRPVIAAVPGATSGARLAEALAESPPRDVAVAFDGDDAGRRAGTAAVDALRALGLRAYVLPLRDGRDLADQLAAEGERGPYWLASALLDVSASEDERLAGQRSGFDVPDGRSPVVTAADFTRTPRQPLQPYVTTADGRSVVLARGTTLLIAGPSGLGKSLVTVDLVARLAGARPSSWLGLEVAGGLRVLLIPYPGEGSDEDVADRLDALVPEDARERLVVWDRWRLGPAPGADPDGLRALAREAADHAVDVIVPDTGSAFFSGAFDVSKGIPEDANAGLESVRDLAGRPLSFVSPVHTRKKDTRAGSALDELEEVAGTFAKKADAAIVIRRDGEDRGPRRRVTFAKCRRGPEPETVIAQFPGVDSDDPPRLSVVADLGGATVKAGTEGEAIAAWIAEQPAPVPVAEVTARFELSPSTLRRRAPELDALGVARQRAPGVGNSYAYGTAEQWATVLGLGGAEAS
ncbi:MAG: AAA family ATPase [Solirubrobacteraceae bacterium]